MLRNTGETLQNCKLVEKTRHFTYSTDFEDGLVYFNLSWNGYYINNSELNSRGILQ